MERILVSLEHAAEYKPAAGEPLPFGYTGGDKYIVTNDVEAEAPLDVVSALVAQLMSENGAVSFGNEDVRSVISFRKYISAVVSEAPADLDTMQDFFISDLIRATR